MCPDCYHFDHAPNQCPRRIPVGINGLFALVDAEDFDRISQHIWSPFKSKTHRTTYARRTARQEDGRETTVLMHREVMNAEPGTLLDHHNRNGLDNRKQNLRVATKQINALNSDAPTLNRLGFRGVQKNNGGELYSARVKLNQRYICIGSFQTAEEAARAYDKKAIEVFGVNARLNFPEEATCPDCFHRLHTAGQCAFDSCGESEVIFSQHGPGILSVSGKRRSPRTPTTPAEEEQIRQLYASGKSIREVGKLVGRSHNIIARICKPIVRDRIVAMKAARTCR